MKQEIINNQDIYNSLEKAFSPAKIGISLININNNNVVYNDIIKQLLGKQNINDIADLFNNLDNNNIALIKEYFENNDDNLTIKQSNLNPKTNQPLNFEIKLNKLNSILYTHSCIVYDNTDSELKKEEIITDLKIINNKIETKNNIISEMNTQIKTPLNAIIGFAELLVETSDKEEQKELLWHLDNNNETFLSLINTIIDIVNIKSDSIKINKSDININDVLNNTLNAISREEISKRIIINHKENIILYTDGNLLTKVLITLIKFANNIINNNSINIKYYKDNSIIKIHLEGVTKTPISDNYYNIIKEENTVSIESDIDNELYLDLATYIIKLLSGDIQISRDQNLLSLNISLPINENENKESLALKLENVAIKQEIKPLTILIAEDNDNNFKLLKYILRKQYNIRHAKNGEEAVELDKKSIPDLILMDIKMPIMDGIEAAKVIRESSIEIPIIAVTAFTYDKDAELEMGNLFNSIISKPVNELELQKNIAKFIK